MYSMHDRLDIYPLTYVRKHILYKYLYRSISRKRDSMLTMLFGIDG